MAEDIWNSPDLEFWENNEGLTDEDVIIEDDQYVSSFPDEEEDDEIFNSLMQDDETDVEKSLKSDPYLSSWIPSKSKPQPTGNMGKYAVDYLTSKGLPKHVSAGIVGNLIKESNLNPTIQEKGNTGNGRGIAQWDVRNRWKDLQSYAAQTQRSHTDLDTQLDFVLHEAQQRGDLQKTLQAKTPEEAAMIFGRTYERPSEKYADWGTRQSTARTLSMKYGGKAQYGNVTNIPQKLMEISDDSIQQVLDDETSPQIVDINEDQQSQSNFMGTAVNVAQGVQKGLDIYDKVKSGVDKFTNGVAQTTSQLIDLQTEMSANQNNAISMRKFNERKNTKRYYLNQKPNNQSLIYT